MTNEVIIDGLLDIAKRSALIHSELLKEAACRIKMLQSRYDDAWGRALDLAAKVKAYEKREEETAVQERGVQG